MKRRASFSEFRSVVQQAIQRSPPVSPMLPKTSNIEERPRESDAPIPADSWLFRPNSAGRLSWDIATLIMILYQAAFVPMYLGFMLPLAGWSRIVELVVTFSLIINILLSLNTGFYDHGLLVMQRKLVLKRYIHSGLWLDILCYFPFDLAASDRLFRDESVPEAIFQDCMSTQRVLLVTRLLALVKVPGILKSIEDVVSSGHLASTLTVLKKVGTVLIIGHCIACFWYFVAEMQGSWTQITWTVRMRRERLSEPSLSEYYVYSVYWAYTVMLTVGFGDIVPQSTAERLYATVCMLIACCVFAYVLGSIGSIVEKQSAVDDQYRERMISMNAYMNRKQFPESLRFRVRQYMKTTHDQMRVQPPDEKKIFELLSDPLKDEISAYVHGTAVHSYPLFRKLSRKAVAITGRSLKDELFAEGDLIFAEGMKQSKLYYVERGEVEISHLRTRTQLRILREGRYFGQIGFFLRHARCASATCMGFVHVLSLDRDAPPPEKNDELELIITEVQSKCADGDLTELRIRCFLCNAMGHVALRCKVEVVNAGGDVVRRQWLARRKQNSVNPRTSVPNFPRKSRKIKFLQRRYSLPTLRLQAKINAYTLTRSSSRQVKPILQEPLPEEPIFHSAPRHPSYFFDSESDEASHSAFVW